MNSPIETFINNLSKKEFIDFYSAFQARLHLDQDLRATVEPLENITKSEESLIKLEARYIALTAIKDRIKPYCGHSSAHNLAYLILRKFEKELLGV